MKLLIYYTLVGLIFCGATVVANGDPLHLRGERNLLKHGGKPGQDKLVCGEGRFGPFCNETCVCIRAPCNCGGCPTVDPAVSCLAISDPVTCNSCGYNNICTAVGAGWNETDCTYVYPRCPAVDSLDGCVGVLAPVVCNTTCQYASLCAAENAGFNEMHCQATKGGLNGGNASSCPVSEIGVSCIDIYAPVNCGGCEYGNICEAGNAGYNETECKSVPINDCPVVDSLNGCVGVYSPVLYGDSACEYASLCAAQNAGWNETDCEATGGGTNNGGTGEGSTCPLINPLLDCPPDYVPLVCGPNACEYTNTCGAKGAGWNVGDNCTFVDPVTMCPLIGPAVDCLHQIETLACGSSNCTYNNLCEASGAGWKEGECVSLCPPPSPAVTCPARPRTVQCGDYGCEYNNLCEAHGAGWKRKQCSRV